MPPRPEELVAAALFEEQSTADEAWGRLADAGVPAVILLDPGLLGAFRWRIMVYRRDLDRAVALIADLVG